MSGFSSILFDSLFGRTKGAARRAELVLLATKTQPMVKEILRPDGTQRLRIYRGANDAFGGVIEDRGNEDGDWMPIQFVGARCVYDSAETVQQEARSIIPWLRSHPGESDGGPT